MIGVLDDVLILAGVSINFQGIVQGAIIIGAVALTSRSGGCAHDGFGQ